MESAEARTLYDRLGGVYSIATVVDDFIDSPIHCAERATLDLPAFLR